jgi:UDP-N-acetyl-2-amino-2-deoxyglucuronate dehydrogenase
MKNFAIIGVAGFIAPRHLKAIKDTGNTLLAAVDKNDSVGILDSFFPEAAFFIEFERFDRHVEKLKRNGQKIDYFVICSPNYLHDAHIRFALRYGAEVICEKPLVLNPWNIATLSDIEFEMKKKINTILQLRLHPEIIELKKKIDGGGNTIYDVELTYITSRGSWYYASWKGDQSKSGGIATNIGIHFFDMLIWIFGMVQSSVVNLHTFDRAAGLLFLEKAKVKWFLSINEDTMPKKIREKGLKTYRTIKVNDEIQEFSDGFTDLHNLCYKNILDGNGYGLADSLPSIQLAHDIRNDIPKGLTGEYHPMCEQKLTNHPFK